MATPLQPAVAALQGVFGTSGASAQSGNRFDVIKSEPISQTWRNAGVYFCYLSRHKGLNDRNSHFRREYRFLTVAFATAGTFYNSDRAQSHHVGA